MPTTVLPKLIILVLAPLFSACVSGALTPPPAAPPAPPPALAVSGDSNLDAMIAAHAEENGVPLALAHAVIRQESRHNPRARGRGTVGLMQIKPATARGIGYRGSTEGLYDPDTNLTWGMRYLAGAYQLAGGDICGTVLRYQGGHRATRMTKASARYCADVKRTMAAL